MRSERLYQYPSAPKWRKDADMTREEPCNAGKSNKVRKKGEGKTRLAHKDSNPDKQNQNLLCYRYTMSQNLFSLKRGKDKTKESNTQECTQKRQAIFDYEGAFYPLLGVNRHRNIL